MTQNKADCDRRPESQRGGLLPSGNNSTTISGDPGIGGLLADPEEPVLKPEHGEKIARGAATPDPEQPSAHGDWAPNRAWHGRSGEKH
jgi:hypothetical protein